MVGPPSYGRRAAKAAIEKMRAKEPVAWIVSKFGATPAKELGLYFANSAGQAIEMACKQHKITDTQEIDRLFARRR